MGKENESKEKLTDLTKVTQKIVGFPGDASGIKNSSANAGDIRDVGSIPGLGRSPGEGMAIHSSVLTWRIPWTEKSGGLQFMGSQRTGYN